MRQFLAFSTPNPDKRTLLPSGARRTGRPPAWREPRNVCHQGTKTRRNLLCYSFL